MKTNQDKHYWALIAEMGWGLNPDYKTISKNAFDLWGKDVMAKLSDFVRDRVMDLGKAVEEYEQEHLSMPLGSDDSFSDLRYHVVGLGKAEFDACMKNPFKLSLRHSKGAYKESFAYCFQEPEPARTSDQKAATLDNLLAKIRQIDEELDVLANKMDCIRNMQGTLVQLANRVADDCKNIA